MKKILLFIAIFAMQLNLIAQTDAFNYQGIARATNGDPLANKNLGIKISILATSATGTVVYEETHTATTNAFGLFSLAIGKGTVVTGSLSLVNWAVADHFVKIEMDPDGGTTYTDLGTSQLLSVPYAKQASAINIYQGGTTNPDKVVIGHSPDFQDWGLIYDDNYDVFRFISSSIPVFNIDLGNSRISIPSSTVTAGQVLVATDAEGTAAWESRSTRISSLTIPVCQSLVSVNHNFTKIADLGTFTKHSSGTYVELILNTRFNVGSFSGTSGVIYQLRIDNNAANYGNGSIVIKSTTDVNGVINANFTSMAAGTHTISIWARTPFSPGTAANVGYDLGCWSHGNSLIVKEFY